MPPAALTNVSVIIPCHNGANYLAQALESAAQKGVAEIIVVDDGSTDNTAEIARGFGCRLCQIPHSGLSAARNAGIGQARGDFILFLDHDDILLPDAVAHLLGEFAANPGADCVMSMAQDFISPELDGAERGRLMPRREPYYGLLSGCALFRRQVCENVKFDENLLTSQSLDYMGKLEETAHKNIKAPFVSVSRRLHASNMGRLVETQEKLDAAAILRRKFRREMRAQSPR